MYQYTCSYCGISWGEGDYYIWNPSKRLCKECKKKVKMISGRGRRITADKKVQELIKTSINFEDIL